MLLLASFCFVVDAGRDIPVLKCMLLSPCIS